jgi:ribosomal protein S18 acetylase RimI-like enzyme
MDVRIGDDECPDDADELRAALFAFNNAATSFTDGRPMSCYLRDEAGALIAGLDGFSWGGYARVEFLWVDDAHRGRGIGSRLMRAAIDEARHRGCTSVVLDTHTFQAPEFYRRLGFVEVGRTVGTPQGHDQVLMQLDLS